MSRFITADLPHAVAAIHIDHCRAFFQSILVGAMNGEAHYGVSAAVTLAQAAWESEWGKYESGANNVFGIKGHGDAGYRVCSTKEFLHGHWQTTHEAFASYSSRDVGVLAHTQVFQNPVYGHAMHIWQTTQDPVAFAHALTGVYATDPNYGTGLQSVMVNYGLVHHMVQ